MIAVACAVFLVLAGTGTSSALWSSEITVSTTVSSGTHSFAQDSFAEVAASFSSNVLTDTASVRVQNTGTITAPFSMAITAPSGALATSVAVRTWETSSPCTSASVLPAAATSSNWTDVPVIAGTLAGGMSSYHCVRTSVTAAQAASLAGTSVTPRMALASTVGSWTTATAAIATQRVLDTTAPTRPAAPAGTNTSGYSTTLTWPASTDNVAVSGYRIFRNGVLLTTVTSPTYTDSTLDSNATYSYTVQAFDAVPNYSTVSTAGTVTTLPLAPTTFYRVTGQGSGMCLDGSGTASADGAQLIISGCVGSTNQGWRLTPTTDGFYSIAAQIATTRVWSVASGGGATDGARALVRFNAGNVDQQWRVVQQSPGVYKFVNRNSAKCLDVQNNMTVAGTPLLQYTCNMTTAQSFTLAVN